MSLLLDERGVATPPDDVSKLVERLNNASALSNPTEADYCLAKSVHAIASLREERDEARANLAALSLCEPGFLERVIRERDEARERVRVLEGALRPFAEAIRRTGPDAMDPDVRLDMCREDLSLFEFGKASAAIANERTAITAKV